MKDMIINANGIRKTFANNGEQVHDLSGLDIDIYIRVKLKYNVAACFTCCHDCCYLTKWGGM